VLSDDAREAQVAQARALYNQRKIELEARRKLIEQGTLPKLELSTLNPSSRPPRPCSPAPRPNATAVLCARRGMG
ncbi:MAG: hypothetical protein AB7K35_03715, partial [Pseudorhodoplanes sp.]